MIRSRAADGGQRVAMRAPNASASGAVPSAWTERGGNFTTPANTAYVRLELYNYMNSGWVAFDDVSLTAVNPAVVTRKYYYAGGQRVAMRENGTLHYLLGDHLGSTSVTANSSGGKTAELRYYPFGETRYTDNDTPTERRFTGQIEDGTIGLYFYNARYYDASLGRFTQADTIVPNPADPQSLNRYSYVLNNPLRYTDPSGHWYYDPGCQCLVKTKDPSHENAIDPVSRQYVGPGNYTNYNETAANNPSKFFFPQGPSLRPLYAAKIPPPDFDNPLPDGNPPPPQVDGLPDGEWEWNDNWPGLGKGYRNREDPADTVYRPDRKTGTREGEDPHWHRRRPGERGPGQAFPPNYQWGRGKKTTNRTWSL